MASKPKQVAFFTQGAFHTVKWLSSPFLGGGWRALLNTQRPQNCFTSPHDHIETFCFSPEPFLCFLSGYERSSQQTSVLGGGGSNTRHTGAVTPNLHGGAEREKRAQKRGPGGPCIPTKGSIPSPSDLLPLRDAQSHASTPPPINLSIHTTSVCVAQQNNAQIKGRTGRNVVLSPAVRFSLFLLFASALSLNELNELNELNQQKNVTFLQEKKLILL